MRWSAVWLGLAVMIAGCSDDSAKNEQEDDPFDDFDDEPLDAGKGLIRGVVLDPSIAPVVEATVTIQGTEISTATNENGAFQFRDVDPGEYFVQAGKPGFTTVQSSVQVVADERSPPIVKLQIEALAGTEPRAETISGDGFVSCSVGLPVIATSCAVAEEKTTIQVTIAGQPDWIQTETIWESTQPAGDTMYTIQAICDASFCPDNDGDSLTGFPSRFAEGSVQSVFVARAGPDFIAERNLSAIDDPVVAVDMSADGPALATGVALDQRFTVYVTLFYNVEPDEGWTFIEDGDYEV